MAKAIHTMIRVLDLDASVDFYAKAFDLRVADRLISTISRWCICETRKTTSRSN